MSENATACRKKSFIAIENTNFEKLRIALYELKNCLI